VAYRAVPQRQLGFLSSSLKLRGRRTISGKLPAFGFVATTWLLSNYFDLLFSIHFTQSHKEGQCLFTDASKQLNSSSVVHRVLASHLLYMMCWYTCIWFSPPEWSASVLQYVRPSVFWQSHLLECRRYPAHLSYACVHHVCKILVWSHLITDHNAAFVPLQICTTKAKVYHCRASDAKHLNTEFGLLLSIYWNQEFVHFSFPHHATNFCHYMADRWQVPFNTSKIYFTTVKTNHFTIHKLLQHI